jgi:hypothetical protein
MTTEEKERAEKLKRLRKVKDSLQDAMAILDKAINRIEANEFQDREVKRLKKGSQKSFRRGEIKK